MATHDKHHADHHIVSPITYVGVLAALLVLMISTVAVSYINLPSVGFVSGTVLNQLFAMVIAVIKASLVVMFFMGVKWATNLTKFWALLGFAWLSFFTIMAGDYAMRSKEEVQGWEPSYDSALPRRIGASEGALPNSKPIPPNEINVRPRQ